MKKTATLFFIIVLLAAGCDDYPSREDIPIIIEDAVADYDGNHYDAVHIGNKVWMAENLRTTHYADGIEIPAGNGAISDSIPYRYAPDSNANNVEKYGYLYNWPAVMHGAGGADANPSGVQGICPDGWHVPSCSEWNDLIVSVDRKCYRDDKTNGIAKSLASKEGWNATTTAGRPGYEQYTNNKTGFNAYPAGCVIHEAFGHGAFFWTTVKGHHFCINNNDNNVHHQAGGETGEDGYLVRCVKD
jgi:uncharacterized protein (TIGR02145 family)